MSKITFEFELVDHSPCSPMQAREACNGFYEVADADGCVWNLNLIPKNTPCNSNNGLSEALLLKAIAVSQDPNLITQM